MTNPHPSGQPYSTSPVNAFAGFRRSSYASVAAGTASAISPPLRPGGLSHLLRSEELDGQRERDQATYNPSPLNMTSGRAGVERSWPQFGHADYSLGNDIPVPAPDFICPSYLRNSRYAKRLAEEHRAAVNAAKESRRQGKHVYHTKDNPPSASLSTSSSGVNLPKLASGFGRSPLQDAIESLPPMKLDEGLKKLPSCWSETDRCSGLDLLNGGTEVRFAGQTKTSDEAAAVRSDYPMPKEVGLYYFEVTILSRGKEGLIGIGFSSPKASLNRLPGWEPDSWAYHGDDGFSFACTASGKQYGPKFSAFDVIGCGVNFKTSSAFFTKNGQYIGEAFHNIKPEKLYPSVGMKKPGEHLRVNFGATPFVFDIDAMMESERAKVREDINRLAITTTGSQFESEEKSLIQELIAQYLAHDGYVETARAFADEVHTQRASLSEHSQPLKMFDPSQDVHAVNRQKIRSAILDGDIDKALKYILTYYPQVLERAENRDIYFKLRCRKFIEMMRRSNDLQTALSSNITSKAFGKLSEKDAPLREGDLDLQMELDEQLQRESRPPTIPPVSMPAPLDPNILAPGDVAMNNGLDDSMDASSDHFKPSQAKLTQHSLLTEALNYGRELSVEFSSDPRPAVKQALNDTFALIAYTDARESVVGGLMEGKGRVEIAEEVNAAILVSLGKPSSAALEKMCAQTEVMCDLLSQDGGAGAFVNVSKDCLQ